MRSNLNNLSQKNVWLPRFTSFAICILLFFPYGVIPSLQSSQKSTPNDHMSDSFVLLKMKVRNKKIGEFTIQENKMLFTSACTIELDKSAAS